MKYFFFGVISCFVIFNSCKKPEYPHESKNIIKLGIIDSLFSEVLNEQRRVWVYVPHSDSKVPVAPQKYPVLYLLDGDAHFYSVAGMIHQLSSVNGNTVCPKMIIIGVENTDRTRDLTPTYVKNVWGDTTFSQTSGGAEKFTRFLREELIHYIDKKYPTTTHRTLVGHSFGGLFAINTLLKHTDMFTNYLAIDPSLWWDNRKLFMEAEQILAHKKFEGKSLYIAMANTMQEGMKLTELSLDTTQSTQHIRSILEFTKKMEAGNNNGINFDWKYYEQDDHGSVPLIATYDGLRSMYSWYPLKGMDKYFEPGSSASTEEVVKKVTGHYENISSRFGYEVLPPEDFINSLGYGFMENGMKERALAFFSMNITYYSESANVYDSMGDYYLEQGDTVKAITFFTKALDKADVPFTKEKLEKLKGER